MIHAGSVISTKQPYRVVVTLFDTSRAAGVGGRLDAFIPRALPAAVAVRLSNKGSVIAEEMRESYADTTVSVSFKVLHYKGKNPNLLLSQASFANNMLILVRCRSQLSDHDALEHSLYLEVEGNHYGGLHGSLFKHRRQIKVLRPELTILVDTNRRVYSPGSKGRKRDRVKAQTSPVFGPVVSSKRAPCYAQW